MSAAAAALRAPARVAPRPAQLALIVNPTASGLVGPQLSEARRLLHGSFSVRAQWTEGRGHATELAREAARAGVDVVAVVGGDGTVNEVAGALANTGTALACLPAGVTNVFARSVGVPRRLLPAAERLAAAARAGVPGTRSVDLGTVNGRAFVTMSGIGFSASMSAAADAAPSRKARLGQLHFVGVAASELASRYLRRPPRMRVRAGGREIEGMTLVVQNSHALTYFGPRAISALDGGLDTGAISLALLRRARPTDVPAIVARLVGGAPVTAHPQVEAFEHVPRATVTSADGAPLPVEADGEYLGEWLQVDYGVLPGALRIVQYS